MNAFLLCHPLQTFTVMLSPLLTLVPAFLPSTLAISMPQHTTIVILVTSNP
jgi:hypothetical protein